MSDADNTPVNGVTSTEGEVVLGESHDQVLVCGLCQLPIPGVFVG